MMSNDEGEKKPEETDGDTKEAPPKLSPEEFRRMKRAIHEAAHAVVADEHGWEPLEINILPGLDQKLTMNWGDFEAVLHTAQWEDAKVRAQWKARVLQFVEVFVAGHLAEKELFDETELKVSQRLSVEILSAGVLGRPDRDRVAWALKKIRCGTIKQVEEAETEASRIYNKRKAHLDALAEKLFRDGKADTAEIRAALGK